MRTQEYTDILAIEAGKKGKADARERAEAQPNDAQGQTLRETTHPRPHPF